ncbi:MAG: branched-chain amino acid ABC transporter ATP-binding protein/permease [Candidatus Dormibacteria bacterium]
MRQAGTEFRRWATANRLAWVAGAWIGLIVVIGLTTNASLTSTAARAVYLLLAVYALHVLANESGQPSLGHAAFLAVGAYVTAGLRLRLGLDGLLATVLAAFLGGAVGWIMGWGATRLRPPILALLTWAFGWLVYVALGAFPKVTGGVSGLSLHAPLAVRWDALGIDVRFNDFAHLVLGSMLLALFLILYRSAQDSAVGRAWAALRDSRTLASALGHDVPATRRWTFAMSAAVAAVAGSLGAQLLQVVDPTLYSPLQSLNLFVAVLIGAPLGFLGPVIGALVVSGAPPAVDYASQVSGLTLGPGRELAAAALMVTALWFSVRLERRRQARGQPGSPGATGAGTVTLPLSRGVAKRPSSTTPPVLSVTGLTVDFDGLRALDNVEIALGGGAISGLIGPNGSGKSTLLRCLSGTIHANRGTITLQGQRIDDLGEAGRVQAGIARTFQRTAVMPHLTAREHVEVGMRTRYRHATTLQALLKSPAYRAEAAAGREEAQTLLATFGLAGAADALPDTLSSGRQRLLQMATSAATRPQVLLLDEPSAGMSADELHLLRRALRTLASEGMAILLIEHNMRFLADIAGQVTVLEGGRVLATGTSAQVTRNTEVRRAYLGVNAAPRPRPRSTARTRRG